MQARRGIRWRIVWILFFSTTINYINRQTFSLLSPTISNELHFSHEDLARIISSFQIAYAGTWLLGGVLLDFIGVRWGLSLAVVWWSIASIFTGFANSVASFSFFRFLLGIGEGLNWPGASKVVAEWFPARERGIAVAIFDSGSSIGAAVAAVCIPFLSLALGWRTTFAVSGVLGVVWLAFWWTQYRPRDGHPNLTAEEAAIIDEGIDLTTPKEPFLTALGKLWKNRNAWGILLGRSLTDPMWWFYVFWLPQYLSDARGFSLKQIAAFAWIPFVAADIGNFTGGWVSGLLIKRGMPVLRARKWICVVTCLPMFAGIPAVLVHSPFWAVFLICVALWGYAAWSTMGLTFPSDLFDQRVVGTVTGLSGFGAGMAGTGVTLAVGYIVDKFSYMPAFIFVSFLPLAATASVLLLIRQRSANARA
ncbi:MAG TPA: MFS transporter [Bryobacteraceae bacterium]|nr:MFS transporter [Bryobacteraceae bacterium]